MKYDGRMAAVGGLVLLGIIAIVLAIAFIAYSGSGHVLSRHEVRAAGMHPRNCYPLCNTQP